MGHFFRVFWWVTLGLRELGHGCVIVRAPVRKARRMDDGVVLEG